MHRSCKVLIPSAVIALLVLVVGGTAAHGQSFECHSPPDSVDALIELSLSAPYENGATLPAMSIALHVLHETSGAGGFSQAAVDSLLERLANDFAQTGIMFVLVEQNDVNNSEFLHSPIDSASALISAYAESGRIDIFIGENAGR